MFVNYHFDISASNLDNIIKFLASRIIIYFLPKAFIGTVLPPLVYFLLNICTSNFSSNERMISVKISAGAFRGDNGCHAVIATASPYMP
jgi:hypothetical protein